MNYPIVINYLHNTNLNNTNNNFELLNYNNFYYLKHKISFDDNLTKIIELLNILFNKINK